MHYFDANATTPLEPAARSAWLEVTDGDWVNPSSPTRAAARVRNRLEACRDTWAGAFAARPEQIVFTAGATEANNAIFAHLAREEAADARVLISAVEHSCVREAARRWFPGRVEVWPVDRSGRVVLEGLRQRLAAEPYALVAVMAANNETGVLQPIAAVAEACRIAGVRLLCDAAQWIGKRPLNDLPRADFVTLSGHKFGGPRGCGVLVLGDAVLDFRGRVGGGQEHGRHAGTENVAGIAALTAAFQAQPPEGWSSAGRDAFVRALEGSAFAVLGQEAERLPNTVSLLLPRHRSTRWIARLDRRDWLVSSGSACVSRKDEGSSVLAAMGLNADEARRVIRVSGLRDCDAEAWLSLRHVLDVVLAELDEDAESERLTTVIEV